MIKWVVDVYLKHSKPNDLLILDNLQSHKNQTIVGKLKENKRIVIYIPAYCSELNPCDNSIFSMIKSEVKEKRLENLSIDELVNLSQGAISDLDQSKTSNYFSHCCLDIWNFEEESQFMEHIR